MTIFKYIGAAAGALPGIVTLNPALAVAGGSIGYGIGGSIDASNASADAVDQANAAAAGVTTPNGGQFTAPTGYWGGGDPGAALAPDVQANQDAAAANQSAMAGAQQDVASAQAAYDKERQAAIGRLIQKGYLPGSPQLDVDAGKDPAVVAVQTTLANAQNKASGIQAQGEQLKSQGHDLQTKVAGLNSDQNRFTLAGEAAQHVEAPQLERTTLDFSGAQPYEATNQADHNAQSDLSNKLANDQTGSGQNALIGRLNSDLAGGQPSLALAQLNQTTQQNLAAQRSMVATAGPMDFAAAQRAAIMAGANSQQSAVGQAAVLRAQEYAQARGELGNVLGQQRGQTLQGEGIASQNLMSQRGQDIQSLGQQYSNILQGGQFTQGQNLNQAQLDAQQRGLNAQREAGYLGAYQTSQGWANQYPLAYAQMNTNANLGAQQIKAGLTGQAINAQQADAASQRQMAGSVLSGGATMLSSGISSGAFSSGGASPPVGAPTGQVNPYTPQRTSTIGGGGSSSPYNSDGTLTGSY